MKLGENQKNAISPMSKKYQNLLSNNNDAPLVSQGELSHGVCTVHARFSVYAICTQLLPR